MTTKRGRPQVLKQEAIDEAIRLCMRPQGATSEEIGKLLELDPLDAPWRLRYFVKRDHPELDFRTLQMTPGQKYKFGYESSNSRIFKIKPKDNEKETKEEIST